MEWPKRFVAQQRRAMGQVVKLQTAHAVEAEALLGAKSAEASRQRERLLGKARDARNAARAAARARAAAERRRKGIAEGSAEDLAATRVEQREEEEALQRSRATHGPAECSDSSFPSLQSLPSASPLAQLLW